MSDGKSPVQMLMHSHRAARQARAPAHRFDLQAEMLKAHRVVSIHRPLKLQTEHPIQVLTSPRQKRRSPFRRAHLKSAIELRDVVLTQKLIRFLHAADAVQPQLLRQTSLPGAEIALASSTRLRRIRRNHLYPQLAQRSSHLRQAMGSTFPPTFGVSQKWLPRSLYNAQNNPLRSITSFSPAITVTVDSSSTNCA